jgi:branched-chain amino acid transport system substrate-binding protein
MNQRNRDIAKSTRRTVIKAMGGGLAASALLPYAAAFAADDITLGILMPLTGAGGVEGPSMLKAAQAAVDEINAAGGPLGRKIKLVVEDDQTDPEAAVRAAHKLVDVDKVPAVLGTWASGVTIAVAPITQAAKIVEMSTSGASRITEIQKKGFVYRTEPDDLLFGRAYAALALKRGWKTAGVLGLNVPFTATTVDAFKKRFEEGGGKVLSFVTYNPDATSFNAETIQAYQGKPDFIHISGYEPDVTGVLRAAYQAGIKVPFVIPSFAVSEQTIANLGPAAEGLIMVAEGVDEKSEGFKTIAKLFPENTYQPHPAQAYDMLNLVALAIESAKDATGTAINSALRAVAGPPGTQVGSFAEGAKLLRQGQKIDYQGASGPIDFDENGNIQKSNFRIAEVHDGKIVPVGMLENVVF